MKLINVISDKIKEMSVERIVELGNKYIPLITDNKFTDSEDMRAVLFESLHDGPPTEFLCPMVVDIIGKDEFKKMIDEGLADGTGGSDDEDEPGLNVGWQLGQLQECKEWFENGCPDMELDDYPEDYPGTWPTASGTEEE